MELGSAGQVYALSGDGRIGGMVNEEHDEESFLATSLLYAEVSQKDHLGLDQIKEGTKT